MIDILQDLKTVGLTALFNPVFLFLLIVLFFLGKLTGWLTRNINIWKFLTLAYFGVFLFRPLQDAGLIIGGVFILGVASNYMDYFRSIFGWAGNVGDVVSAFRYRSTFQDVSRLEREIDDLKRQLHAAQAGSGTAGQSSQQSSWRQQSQARKGKQAQDGQGRSGGSSGGGRGSQGSSQGTSSRNDGASGSSKTQRRQYKNGAGQKEKRGAKFSAKPGSGSRAGTGTQTGSQSASYQSKSRIKDGPSSTGAGRASASQSKASSRKSSSGGSKRKYSNAKPNQKQSTQQNTSGAQTQQRSSQQSNQAGSQGQGAQQAASGSAPNKIRERNLQALELTTGQTYSQKEIKAAWRKMAFKTHPDRGGTAAAFAQALSAYRALV